MSFMPIDDPNAVRTMTRAQATLHRLIRDRGLERYGLFFGTVEGKRLPDGSENASGYVVDDRGRVYFYWLDWDDRHNEAAFTDWEEVRPEPDWSGEPEYRRACEAANLPL